MYSFPRFPSFPKKPFRFLSLLDSFFQIRKGLAFLCHSTLMAFLRRVLLLRLQQTLTPNSMSSLSVHVEPMTNLSVPLIRGHNIGSIPRFSSWNVPIEINLSDEESTRRLHNRLLYRSKQRGFLELDLILGKWVEENIHRMDEARIRYLVDVLDLENPDLWKWISGQEQPPDALNCNPVLFQVFSAIQSKVLENLNSHAAPATRADPGQSWVRGWDDKRGLEIGSKYGNQ